MTKRRAKKELNVEAWITRAKDEERSARALLKRRAGAASVVCFLAQQMAEKYLKALLIHFKERFPKIHDLKRLATLIEPYDANIFQLEERFDVLNRYYVTTRYPGDFPEGFTWRDADEAFKAALQVKRYIGKKLK